MGQKNEMKNIGTEENNLIFQAENMRITERTQ